MLLSLFGAHWLNNIKTFNTRDMIMNKASATFFLKKKFLIIQEKGTSLANLIIGSTMEI